MDCIAAAVVDTAAFKVEARAGIELSAGPAAFVNLRVVDVEAGAPGGDNPVDAAAEETAVGEDDILTVDELKHISGAGAGGFLQMTGGQIRDRNVPAAVKVQHFGIAGCGLQRGLPFPLAHDV